MTFLFKKEYRLGIVLVLAFGLFLSFVDISSEQIISAFTSSDFSYEKKPFLKILYIALGFISFVLLLTLDRSDYSTREQKGVAFTTYIIWIVFAFFPGWFIHLAFVLKTLRGNGSFMALEDNLFIYHLSDITMVAGFVWAGIKKLRPAIHDMEKL